jgi:hypothetical protein
LFIINSHEHKSTKCWSIWFLSFFLFSTLARQASLSLEPFYQPMLYLESGPVKPYTPTAVVCVSIEVAWEHSLSLHSLQCGTSSKEKCPQPVTPKDSPQYPELSWSSKNKKAVEWFKYKNNELFQLRKEYATREHLYRFNREEDTLEMTSRKRGCHGTNQWQGFRCDTRQPLTSLCLGFLF